MALGRPATLPLRASDPPDMLDDPPPHLPPPFSRAPSSRPLMSYTQAHDTNGYPDPHAPPNPSAYRLTDPPGLQMVHKSTARHAFHLHPDVPT
ncbi:hypothetical protein C8R44DRAFT_881554 [Mycena epipterygia]|nr:hypothetical protein C8R44DRAFT_881554 [Mycena epipterygia]